MFLFIIFNNFCLLLISQFFVIPTVGETLLMIWCRFVKYISFDGDNCDKRFSMDRGSCLVTDGG